MSVTVLDVFTKARALLDEYTDDGAVIPDAEILDFKSRAIVYADMAQKELFTLGNYFSNYEFTRKPIQNLVAENFEKHEFTGDTQYFPSESGVEAKSYYIEADGTHTILVQELEAGTWSTLETNSATVTQMTAYKGNLSLSTSGNKVRIVVSGTNWYQFQNIALFEYSFDTVPDYQPWVKFSMPSDFASVESYIIESDKRYVEAIDYKWERFKDFYVSWWFDGTVRINYRPFPTTITDISDTFEIDDPSASAIAYFIAAKLATSEQQNLVNYFEQKFDQLKYELNYNRPAREQEIQDVYRR